MKKIIFSVVCVFISNLYLNNCLSQTTNTNAKKFSFSISPGVSIYTDGQLGLLSSFGIDYLEFLFNYKISKKAEIGFSLGKNNFTSQELIYPYAPDSTITSNIYIFEEYHWAAINLSINFEHFWFIGLKFGTMQPNNGFSETLLGLNLRREIIRSNDFFTNVNLEYIARSTINNFSISSNQINLTFGLGFNF